MPISLQSIPESRLYLINNTVGGLYDAVDSEHPESMLMELLRQVVPCETAVLNAIGLRPNRLVSWSSSRPQRRDISGDPVIARHLHLHPTLNELINAGSHDAVRLSDTGTLQELNRNPFVRDYYYPNGLRQQMTLSVGRANWVVENSTWVIGMHRFDKVNFKDEDVAVANLMRPHLERALKRLELRRERESIHSIHQAASSEAACGTLAVRLDGTILDASPVALDIIARWFGVSRDTSKLPITLCERLGLATCGIKPWVKAINFEGEAGGSLRVQVTKPAGTASRDTLAGLWLKETRPVSQEFVAQALGLTPRQAAIASWISMGKTNAEIAVILGISQRTVDKHLELMLQRLPVENRHGIAEAVRNLG
ncbi:MAG: LuxR C-terminal-related transcriptional regulator [Verrucomicrobiota bacterium]|nr:LuxR C-terminal-related transcriptional regulator [Verrucomicrobiota bacterium]